MFEPLLRAGDIPPTSYPEKGSGRSSFCNGEKDEPRIWTTRLSYPVGERLP